MCMLLLLIHTYFFNLLMYLIFDYQNNLIFQQLRNKIFYIYLCMECIYIFGFCSCHCCWFEFITIWFIFIFWFDYLQNDSCFIKIDLHIIIHHMWYVRVRFVRTLFCFVRALLSTCLNFEIITKVFQIYCRLSGWKETWHRWTQWDCCMYNMRWQQRHPLYTLSQ